MTIGRALLATAAVALLLDSCGASTPSASHPTAPPGLSSAHPSVPTTASPAPCSAPALRLSGQQASLDSARGAPTVTIYLSVTNTGPAACTLVQPETEVALVTVAGQQPLPVPYQSGSLSTSSIVLRPGATASGNMVWVGWCSPPPGPLTVQISFGDGPPVLASPPPPGLGTATATPTACGDAFGSQPRFDSVSGETFGYPEGRS